MNRRGRRSGRRQGRAAPLTPGDVVDALASRGDMRWSGLLRHFDARGDDSGPLKRLVDGLVASGAVELARNGRYRLTDPPERLAGIVAAAGDGKLRLETPDGRLHTLGRAHRVRGVREGDEVEAALADGEATVHRIVVPSPEPIVGEFRDPGQGASSDQPWRRYLVPHVESLSPELRGRIDLVAPAPGVRGGAIVEVEVLEVDGKRAAGRVRRIIDAGNEAERAAEAALAAFRVPTVWPDGVDARRPAPAAGARSDLRELPLVTIDGEDARDFDDAVFAEPRAGGGWRLVVAIADVAHFVRPGSALDTEARRRGNSVYLPDRVVPMLPEYLSAELCSLRPNEDRLAMVCDMRISAAGRISGHEFGEGLIRSHARLTYTQANAFLEGREPLHDDAVAASLRSLHDVWRALDKRRQARGALDLDLAETVVALDGGRPSAVRQAERNDAHRLIEEAMIAANVAAARHLERVFRGAGGDDEPAARPVYRVHEAPARDRLDALEPALKLAGVSLPPEPLTPAALGRAVARARENSSMPDWIWHTLTLRSLTQARYEARRLGHFGLALPTYLHFTSPIRRYSDLLVHRMLKGWQPDPERLAEDCAHISMTERRAESAERMVAAWLKCVLIERRTGEAFEGTVAGVTGFGLFIELDGTGVQGLLPIGKLGADYFHHTPAAMALVGERSGRRFALGDRMQVVLEEVSPPTGRVDLVLPERGVRRGRRRRRSA